MHIHTPRNQRTRCDAVGYERERTVNSDRDMRSEARCCGSRRLASRAFKDSVGLWCILCESQAVMCIFFYLPRAQMFWIAVTGSSNWEAAKKWSGLTAALPKIELLRRD